MSRSKYLVMILALAMILVMLGVAPVQAAYNLVWSDEFNGTSVDTSKWVFETGNNGGWGNGELEYYQAANATVSGGILTITAKKENVGGCSYTSTRMKTAGKFSFTYGKAEARLLIPKGKGLWPAFWMLGNSINSGTVWPDCGEVDIMEHVNTDDNCVGTIHWNSGGGHAQYGQSIAVSNIATWHTYSIEWTSSYIRWFVDGVQYCEANILNNINNTGCFHKPFFFLLNLAVGGAWPGSPDGTTPFPAQYQIDYVRVYQDNGTPVATPTTTPGVTPTATKTPTPAPTTSGTVGSATWYLFNQTVSGVTPAGQNMQTAKSGTTGWQPTKSITTTSSYWYGTPLSGTYNAGTWTFVLWTNNPGTSSQVKVDVYKVNSDGGGAVLIASQTKEAGTSGGGNHATTYTFSGIGAQTLSNQRLMVKITKSSGTDLTMAYNTNDFPTRLVTP